MKRKQFKVNILEFLLVLASVFMFGIFIVELLIVFPI